MSIYIYIKNTDNIDSFKDVIDVVRQDCDDIFSITESRRSFRELDKLKRSISTTDIVVIYDSVSLGLNEADISNELNWFIENSICLVICNIESTYCFGVYQPMNKAILTTLLQSILSNNKNIVKFQDNRRKNSGRNKIMYPDNWDELYELWINKDITSREFLDRSGLKKATFYNLITDYKEMQKDLESFKKQYKLC